MSPFSHLQSVRPYVRPHFSKSRQTKISREDSDGYWLTVGLTEGIIDVLFKRKIYIYSILFIPTARHVGGGGDGRRQLCALPVFRSLERP